MATRLPRFRRVHHVASFAALLLFSGSGFVACSLLLDHDSNQCTVDADCAKFPGGPGLSCVSGVCVAGSGVDSGGGDAGDGGVLNPPDCFSGTPTTADEYANACTAAQCVAFDDCARLGLCDAGADAGAAIPPPLVDGGATTTEDGGAPPPPTVDCYDPVLRPDVIYISGGTNLPPLLKLVAPLLAQDTPPYTVVFFSSSSCAGADAIFSADPALHIIQNQPPNYATYYDVNGNAIPCLLDPGGDMVDVGQSDLFASTCTSTYIPAAAPYASVAEYLGPIQPISFAVNANSSQTAISAEAAHMVFGMGGNHGVATPWTNPDLYYIRSQSTGTNQLTSRAISVQPDQWWGIDQLTATNMTNALIGVDPAAADSAIGVLSTDSADSAGANLRELFFQASGQRCGFLPDTTAFTKDKMNVRDGHYPIWGPMHFYTEVDASLQPSAAASAFVLRFSVPQLDQALLMAITTSGLIPACAMKVNRTAEMGPLEAYSPAFQCGCYYDSLVKGTTSCKPCAVPADCPADLPACNYGYCELK
jgi:hypothetical protein